MYERVLVMLKKAIEKPSLAQYYLTHPGSLLQRLQTIPGISSTTGVGLASQLSGVDRDTCQYYVDEFRASDFRQELLENIARKRVDGHLSLQPNETDVGDYLYSLLRVATPGVMVETGVASGQSTAIILKALQMNNAGRLYSIDYPLETVGLPDGEVTGWLVPEDLRDRWELMIGDSAIILPEVLSDLGRIDVFLHDSDHTYEHMKMELTLAWQHLNNGGLLLSDDCHLGAFVDFTWLGGEGAIYGTFAGILKPDR